MAELRTAAAALGVARVVELGYGDSGMDATAVGDRPAFARAPVAEAAQRLAELLRAEGADVLTVYDPAGGYGHPDHRQVHRVGVAAAELAGTPVVLEATVDRRLLLRAVQLVAAAVRLVSWLPGSRGLPDGFGPDAVRGQYADPGRLTHTVDVRAVLDAKRAAMAAHGSQAAAERRGPHAGARVAVAEAAVPAGVPSRVVRRTRTAARPAAAGRRVRVAALTGRTAGAAGWSSASRPVPVADPGPGANARQSRID